MPSLKQRHLFAPRAVWRAAVWLGLLAVLGGSFGTPHAAAAPASSPQADAPLTFPDGFMKSVKDYGAKGDGTSDDTAAIQAALDDGRVDANGKPLYSPPDEYNGRPKALFFPAGTYLVRDTLHWVGCCVTVQGQGSAATVIRLADGAAGFDDPATPRAVIRTESGNMSFRQNIWDVGVNTGRNNAGAMGVDYIANNTGSMRNVVIRSGDGQGVAGLNMDRNWPGPCLITHVQIEGFDYGVRVTSGEYGPTFENLTLSGQRVAGIRNIFGSLAIRKLSSTNSVPAIIGEHQASLLTLLDSTLSGGAPSVSAIDTKGQIYARNVTASGYRSAITYKDAVVPSMAQSEYASNTYQLFDSPKRSLNLPIKETPEYHDANLADWAGVTCTGYAPSCAIAGELQKLLDSGKSTIYFPFATRQVYNELTVTVPASVRRIVGFTSITNGGGTNGGGIKFVVAEASTAPLIIEQFGYGVKVDHASSRTLVLKHGHYRYTDKPGAGDLFLEDVGVEPLVTKYTRHVWARQLNSEGPNVKVDNSSAALWILGLKTETKGVCIRTTNGAKTELLGTVIMGIHVDSPEDKQTPAFIIKDASVSLVYRLLAYEETRNYDLLIEETRGGETRQLRARQLAREVPLFTAYQEAVTPPPPAANLRPQAYLPLLRAR